VLGVRIGLSLSIQVASLLFVVVAGENLSECVLHLHFPIKCSRHEPVWAEWSILLLKSSDWGLFVMLSIIWKTGFPLLVDSIKSLWPHCVHMDVLYWGISINGGTLMHAIIISVSSFIDVIQIRGIHQTLVVFALKDHLSCSQLGLVSCIVGNLFQRIVSGKWMLTKLFLHLSSSFSVKRH
jgi:hypothetical protein